MASELHDARRKAASEEASALKKKARADFEARVAKAAGEGMTITAMCERFGRDRGTISSILKRLGLKQPRDKREPADGL